MELPQQQGSEPALVDSWFKLRAAALPRPLDSDVVSIVPSPKLEGRFGWALTLGGIGGGAGGAAMMIVAAEVARRLRFDGDVIRTIGRTARVLGDDAFNVGIALAVVTGVVVGVFLGALMRYSLRMVARMLAGVLLACTLWTLVHAFVLKSFAAASLGALPFGPMVIGAVAYGLCVGILRPPRKRVPAAVGDD